MTKDITSIKDIIFAYEPINNINVINIDKIKNEIKEIFNYLYTKYNTTPTFLYGGGINKNNIDDIYNIEELKGILIGSISSNINELKEI